MIGRLTFPKDIASREDYLLYRQVRCGVCQMHKAVLGRMAAASLSHDSILFALVASSDSRPGMVERVTSKCSAIPFLPVEHLSLSHDAVRKGTAANMVLFLFKHYDALADRESLRWATSAFHRLYGQEVEDYLSLFTSISIETIRNAIAEAKRREATPGNETAWYLAPLIDVAASVLEDLYGTTDLRRRFARAWASAHLTALSLLDSLEDREEDVRIGSFSLVESATSEAPLHHLSLALSAAREAESYATMLAPAHARNAVHLIYQAGLVSPLIRIRTSIQSIIPHTQPAISNVHNT